MIATMIDPPVFYDAEQIVLGSAILFPGYLPKLKSMCSAADFYHESHRLVWEAILELSVEVSLDDRFLGLLSKRLLDKGVYERIGGFGFLQELMDKAIAEGNVDLYIDKVREYSLRRHIVKQLATIQENVARDHITTGEIAIDLINAGFSISDPDFKADLVPASIIARRMLKDLSEDKIEPAVMTGFYDLDYILSGMTPGNVYVVAARPGMGKTSFLLDVVLNVAQTRPVHFYSMEMPENQIWARLVSKKTGISSQKIIARLLNQEEINQVVETTADLAEIGLFIDSSPSIKPTEIYSKSKIQAAKSGSKAALIVVDYLQYMDSDEKFESQERKIASISRALKSSAMKLSVPILVAAQLNRQIENRPEGERMPRLSDIRESGAIEQDATAVIGLSMHPKKELVVCANVLKNRNGPLHVAELKWDAQAASLKNF